PVNSVVTFVNPEVTPVNPVVTFVNPVVTPVNPVVTFVNPVVTSENSASNLKRWHQTAMPAASYANA
ncbi:MAG: hypothetical protein RMY16_15690, partial [Nostoc sp. DedQUE12b]|uniref:hypothetical protein n=1 Tax=Nostoc sp. DedQUE12b TaxID=3075398 RepID=UPI002AD3BC84